MSAEQNQEWLSQLQRFIFNSLKPIISREHLVQFVNQDAMSVFELAFTHESFNPTDNQEQLKVLGEKVLNLNFGEFLYKNYNFSQGEQTNLKAVYQGINQQALFATNLNLQAYLRIVGINREDVKVSSDLLKAFFGAVFTVANSIIMGLGYKYAYTLYQHIFKVVTLKTSDAEGDKKTYIIQTFKKFGLYSPVEEVTMSLSLTPSQQKQLGVKNSLLGVGKSNTKKKAEALAYQQGVNNLKFLKVDLDPLDNPKIQVQKILGSKVSQKVTVSVTLTPQQMAFLKRNGFILNNPVIGLVTDATKTLAEAAAYQQASDTLDAIGMTKEWIIETKRKIEFSDPALAPYAAQALKKIRYNGFVYLQFFIPSKVKNLVELFAVDQDGGRAILAYDYMTENDDVKAVKRELLKSYVEN